MKTPKFLLGAAVIFWGWQTGLWIFAIPMALILESSYFIPSRIDFSADDIKRISNICLFIFIFLIIYLLITNRSLYFIYNLLAWFPVVFFPLLAAQIYSINEKIDISLLFSLINKFIKSNRFHLNLTYPYFALCILSASTTNNTNNYFYIGLVILSGAALWLGRSQRFSPLIWLCLLLITGGIGFIGQIKLHQLDLFLEERVVTWLSHINQQKIDPLKQQTSIGYIGELKQSNQILFRVNSPTPQIFPLLIREAIYNKYQFSTWLGANPDFTPVTPEVNQRTWRLGAKPANNSTINLSIPLPSGKGLLKLVNGTFTVDQLQANLVEKNRYGAVRVAGKSEAIAYQVQFNQNLAVDSPPTADDLQVPQREKSALNQIIRELDIQGKSPQVTLKRVEKFFQEKFTYTLHLTGREKNYTGLSTFLLKTRGGHCEYFATATTLLLRSLGIPTRYAIGYSAHEFSQLENQYIVRDRHAHAWTMVYVQGRWRDFDTTPADWKIVEDTRADPWVIISDLFSLLSFKFSGWVKYEWWLILPLIFIFGRKFLPQKWQRLSPTRVLLPPVTKSTQRKRDSEFDLIEKALNELGFPRHASESWKNWIQRLKKESDCVDDLIPLIEIYYRDRFDPQGIKVTEKQELKSSLKLWLVKYNCIN